MILALLLAACSPTPTEDTASPPVDDDPPPTGLVPTVDVTAPPPERLSETGLLAWDDGLVYADGVFEYEMNTPLFTDYSLKSRVIYVPDGSATPDGPAGVLDFPVGTHLLKTFLLPPDLREPDVGLVPIETRLLRHTPDGWEAWPYIWNDDLSDAILSVDGEVRPLDLVDPSGQPRTADYLIPSRDQCSQCHVIDDGGVVTTPIGPKPRHIHRDGQLEALVDGGLVTGLDPATVTPATDFYTATADLDALSAEALETAARDYLDINCGHCHRPESVTGPMRPLYLNVENRNDNQLGVCRRAHNAANSGLTYLIVPGDPDASVLVYRMETEVPGEMMPLVGRSLAHDEGVDLIRAWIASMPPDPCQ